MNLTEAIELREHLEAIKWLLKEIGELWNSADIPTVEQLAQLRSEARALAGTLEDCKQVD